MYEGSLPLFECEFLSNGFVIQASVEVLPPKDVIRSPSAMNFPTLACDSWIHLESIFYRSPITSHNEDNSEAISLSLRLFWLSLIETHEFDPLPFLYTFDPEIYLATIFRNIKRLATIQN
jgi:hypothetical protein